MRRILANLNADEVRKDSRYVMQITGDDQQGKQEVDNFIDPEIPYPVIATTSKLSATGVDAQTCKLIVLNSKVESMTDFKQMIGRGTRVRTDYDKWFFVILDFKNVTRLFADKEFDGDPVKVYELPPDGDMQDAVEDLDDVDETERRDEDDDSPTRGRAASSAWPRRKWIVVSGQQVTIIGEQVQMLGPTASRSSRASRSSSARTCWSGTRPRTPSSRLGVGATTLGGLCKSLFEEVESNCGIER